MNQENNKRHQILGKSPGPLCQPEESSKKPVPDKSLIPHIYILICICHVFHAINIAQKHKKTIRFHTFFTESDGHYFTLNKIAN